MSLSASTVFFFFFPFHLLAIPYIDRNRSAVRTSAGGADRNTLDYNAVDRESRPTRNIMKFSFFIIYYIYYALSPHVTTPASYLVHKDYNHGSHLRKMKQDDTIGFPL